MSGDMFSGAYNPTERFQSTSERANLQANNQRSIELAAKIADDYKNDRISGDKFVSALSNLGISVKDLDQYQKNYQATQTENRGTLGENALLSNIVQNATARRAAQETATDALATEIASNPLRQYNLDTDLKREMAFQNQKNLAGNVRDQLTNLQAARNTNAELIGSALKGGGAGLANTSFGR